ncbi:NADH dehydrogenase (ubiquinone) B15 subunit [Bombus fervidus]|uniref:NADH dehydrogenase (ubiquinone) B15 subunit n=1 Tax=Bombus fervidus TaxID=203811 RepID=UPI003AB3382D
MCAQKIESFDISPKQRAILEWKYARRIQLRQKYLKECLNPSMQVMPVDSAVQRLVALRHNHDYVSNMKLVPHLLSGFMMVGAIYYGGLLLKKVKNSQEELYRTGQVAYVDRESKFA